MSYSFPNSPMLRTPASFMPRCTYLSHLDLASVSRITGTPSRSPSAKAISSIALPLIVLPNTDKSNENIGFLFLVHAVLQGRPAPLDSDAKLQKALHSRVVQHSAGNGPHGLEAHLLLWKLIGDIALTPLAGGMQKAALQHSADIGADIVCRGFFSGKGSGHSCFLSVVIISESVADIMDGFLI